MAPRWKVRHVHRSEFAAWTALFRGYCAFYEQPTSDDHQRQIWRWIQVDRSVEALVAVEVDGAGDEVGAPRGLAHLREYVNPLEGQVCGFLDDLFVAPEVRGTGVVDAVFDELRRLGVERGWPNVRWETAPDNLRAQAAYRRVAERTPWVSYDMAVHPGP